MAGLELEFYMPMVRSSTAWANVKPILNFLWSSLKGGNDPGLSSNAAGATTSSTSRYLLWSQDPPFLSPGANSIKPLSLVITNWKIVLASGGCINSISRQF